MIWNYLVPKQTIPSGPPLWHPVLAWAATRGRGAFTIHEVAARFPVPKKPDERPDETARRTLRYAHTTLNKLWKWGYIRKAERAEAEPLLAEIVVRRHSEQQPDLGRGGRGRSQGRHPSVWLATPKGVRRIANDE